MTSDVSVRSYAVAGSCRPAVGFALVDEMLLLGLSMRGVGSGLPARCPAARQAEARGLASVDAAAGPPSVSWPLPTHNPPFSLRYCDGGSLRSHTRCRFHLDLLRGHYGLHRGQTHP